MAAQQGFAEEPSSPPPTTGTCEECFGILNEAQLNVLRAFLQRNVDEICEALEAGTLSLTDVKAAAQQSDLSGATLEAFNRCLDAVFGGGSGH